MSMPQRCPTPSLLRAPRALLLTCALLGACIGDVGGFDPFSGAVPPQGEPLGVGSDGGGPVPAGADAGFIPGWVNDAGFTTGVLPDAGATPAADGGPLPPFPTGDAAAPEPGTPAADAGAPEPGPDASAPPPSSPDVPDIAACADARSWPESASQWELEVLELTNQARAAGHNCDSEGSFGPAPALTMEPRLRCSARLHSAYMAETGDFNHTQTATGLDPFERIAATGYRSRAAGENIAAGQNSPRAVVDGWLDSDGHCRNIMDAGYTELGVGYVLGSIGYKHYWTQNFGRPQ